MQPPICAESHNLLTEIDHTLSRWQNFEHKTTVDFKNTPEYCAGWLEGLRIARANIAAVLDRNVIETLDVPEAESND